MNSIKEDEMLENEEMKQKYEKIHEKLNSFKDKEVDDTMITQVLMIQELLREMGNA